MRELKELLALAIAHANKYEPQPSKRRAVVLFYLKIEVGGARHAHQYKRAFTAMTLIRLINTSETLNPIWKALVAAVGDGPDQGPPTPNRGVRLPSQEIQQSANLGGDGPKTVSSAMTARDRESYERLTEYLSRR